MNASDPVVGCSTCGALYTPAPGDRGHCVACSNLLLDDPPAPVAAPAPRAAPARPLPGEANHGTGASVTRLAPRKRRGSLRPIAIGIVVLGLLGSLGAAVAFRRHDLADAWTRLQRHSPREAWTSARRLASDGWAAIRSRLPFGASEAERTVSKPPAKPPRVAVRGTKTRKH